MPHTNMLTIGGTDFSRYITKLHITLEDMDAEGAGRSVVNGAMYRKRIARKYTIEVEMSEIDTSVAYNLHNKLATLKIAVQYYRPASQYNVATGNFYCSRIDWGEERYNPSEDKIYYSPKFKLVEV